MPINTAILVQSLEVRAFSERYDAYLQGIALNFSARQSLDTKLWLVLLESGSTIDCKAARKWQACHYCNPLLALSIEIGHSSDKLAVQITFVIILDNLFN